MKQKVTMAAASLLLGSGSAMGALFSEDFNDGLAAGRWSVVSQQEGVVGPDGSVDFNFDYSTLGIANPSGGSDTTGVFLQFNKVDDGPVDEGESYSIYPNGESFSGDFILSLNMYIYSDGNAGSTEHGMAGVFLDNGAPVSPYRYGADGGPLAWAYSSDDGAGSHMLGSYAEGSVGVTGYNPLGSYTDFAGVIPGFDDTTGPLVGGEGQWVDVSIEVVGTTITWKLNGAVVGTYDNSGGFYTVGNILIGGMDMYNSSNGGNGVIVDNVVVTPEPASLALLALGGLAMLRRRA